MITIDGSNGEGGGQILRTSLAMSLVTGKPVRIHAIRARRAKPGLMRQHLTALTAAAEIGRADVTGAEIGSREIAFSPRQVTPGNYHFAVGTAGSTMLVLQTVLPALLTAGAPSTLVLEGGTHNPMAPPFDFVQRVFVPIINRMGPAVTAVLDRPGFYPAGGGRCTVSVQPAEKLAPFEILERGAIHRRRARAIVSALPPHVAKRELQVVRRRLGWEEHCLAVETVRDARGPGNIVSIEIESENITEVFTGFGAPRVRAETVAQQAADQARRYLAAEVPVGEHLADQLLIPLALAGAGAFKTLPLSRHTLTNIEVLKSFIDFDVTIRTEEKRNCIVSLGPR